MDITSLLDDDELVSMDKLCELLGPPGKPVSRRTVSRLLNQPDGLPYFEVGGRNFVRLSVVRDHVRKRERHPNPRRQPATIAAKTRSGRP
jgi:hypothetical protein